MSISPIYRFSAARNFSGSNIYNPYSQLDTSLTWKRANFHTHTKIDGLFNECPEYPDVVWEDYKRYGYDILSFSNHNELTIFPGDSLRQIWVYEHGYNPFKFHKLTFSETTLWYDNLLPIFPSQKQFVLNLLGRNADMIVFNHPDRTFFVDSNDMEQVGGYQFIEAYSGIETAMKHWDEALSSGHYSHCILNDDCHDSGNPYKIAIRCTWLNSPSCLYEDVKRTLLSGCYYSMSLPSWADGALEEKLSKNQNLPHLQNIVVQGDTIRLSISEKPLSIKMIGQNGTLLASNTEFVLDKSDFILDKSEPYARFEIEFENGVKIYTNTFARYNDITELSNAAASEIRVFATIFFNLTILLLFAGLCFIIRRLWRYQRDCHSR